MKKNTTEYLVACGIIKTKINFSLIVSFFGLILIFLNEDVVMRINDFKVMSPTTFIIIISLVLIIIGLIVARTNLQQYKRLKEKYNNEEGFCDIIAEL